MKFIKKKLISKLIVIFISVLSSFFIVHYANATQDDLVMHNNSKKILIVYYSRSGNTDVVANYIHDTIGGDIVKIETVKSYPDQYRATTAQARVELDEDFRPELKTKINNITDYDVVFIGSPNWWGTMSMPIRSFLYEYDLSGKQIALFITHEGSRFGRSLDDLKQFAPKTTMLEGIAIRGSCAKNSQQKVKNWLKNIGMIR